MCMSAMSFKAESTVSVGLTECTLPSGLDLMISATVVKAASQAVK